MVLEGNHVLIISHDVVGERMAGPGIRYYHLARVLSDEFPVVLAAPGDASRFDPHGFDLLSYPNETNDVVRRAIHKSSVVVVPAVWIDSILDHLSPSVYVVVDGYDPFVAETLSLGRAGVADLQRTLTQAYLVGDFFMCASERQRDWWLGLLEANGRVNSYTFGEDRSLRRLVDVVPFGLPDGPPRTSQRVVKTIWPGIGADDKVILWGGGLWPWLDPLTAVRAVARVWQQRQDVRLIFPGTEHPNPSMKGIPTHNDAARELAREKGLLNRAVFFGDWIPYADWPNVLLESDVALTLHYDALEARLAFRSRMLDYIWADLPVVATRGDATSDLVEKYNPGTLVDFEDVDGVAKAIVDLLETSPAVLSERFAEAREALTWRRAAQPLVRFCRDPRRAPDKTALGDHLGSPFYVRERNRLVKERDRCCELVARYEQGRFMKLMRGLGNLKERLPWI
ncbi:MAG: glycosyltransferase family 4 protein [bacterium]